MSEASCSKQSDVVRLNVGGHIYQTTIGTLINDSESMLARMFSSDWTQPSTSHPDERFLDRDGRYFYHVLNYLRDGHTSLPSDMIVLRHLLNEAEYYQLHQMMVDIRQMIHCQEEMAKPKTDTEPLIKIASLRNGLTVRWRSDAIDAYWRAFALTLAEHSRLGNESRSDLPFFFELSLHDQPANAPSRQRSFCISCMRTDYLDDVSVYSTQVKLDDWTAVRHMMKYMRGTVVEVTTSTCCVVEWDNRKRLHLPISALVLDNDHDANNLT